jgi:hypothetical protein
MDSKYEEIRAAVDALLERNGVTFSVVLLGERTRDGWKHDAWVATLSRAGCSEDFDFCTGTGLRKYVTGPKNPTIAQAGRPGTIYREEYDRRHLRPVPPRAANVLHSLILDSAAADQTFESWCSEFGYDTNNHKTKTTYRECQKNADKLACVLDRRAREELAELLQDY